MPPFLLTLSQLPWKTIAPIVAAIFLIISSMLLYRSNQALKHDLAIVRHDLSLCRADLKGSQSTLVKTIEEHNATVLDLQTKADKIARENAREASRLNAQAMRLETLRSAQKPIERHNTPEARIDAVTVALEAHRALVKP